MKTFSLLIVFCLTSFTLSAVEKLSWVRAKGTRIVNDRDETVILRGINLGGWLVEEMWMMPFVTTSAQGSGHAEIQDHVSLWKKLEERFGHEKMHTVRTHHRKNWLQSTDFDRIKAHGFNSVRVPFLSDLDNESEGLFPWLDWVVQEAQKRGLWVILDMHGAPGRQSTAEHTGESNHNRFFYEEAHSARAIELWKKIAARYKDSSTIAGYDLLNEPMGAQDMEKLYQIYRKLYQAIREVDTKHIIFVEDGYRGIDHMPTERYKEMDNIALSVHVYKADATTAEEHVVHLHKIIDLVKKFQERCTIPFYLGEFNVVPHGTHETVKKYIEILESHDMSWSYWTYKVAKNWLKGSLWGIYTLKKSKKYIDPFLDSEQEILKKIKQFETDQFVCNHNLVEALKRRS